MRNVDRPAVAVLLACAVAFGAAGCGLLPGRSANPSTSSPGPSGGPIGADTSPFPDLLALVKKSGTTSFTAEYRLANVDGRLPSGRLVLAREAPFTAVSVSQGDYVTSEIWSSNETYTCIVRGTPDAPKCQRRGPSEHLDEDFLGRSDWASVLHDTDAGAAFVLDPFRALNDLELLAVGHATITKGTQTYAGQHASCVKAVATTPVNDQPTHAESCFTDAGLVAYTRVDLELNKAAYDMEFDLVTYSTTVDRAALQPPAKAKITSG
jgi:hypothetical protein